MNAVRYNTVEYLKYFNNLNTYRDVSNMFSNIFPYLANNEISLVNADGTYKSHDIVMEEINDALYEGKFIFNTSVGTQVRTFCSNPSGQVVV